MPEIEDYGITVEEYLEGLEKGVDVLELRRRIGMGSSYRFSFGTDDSYTQSS